MISTRIDLLDNVRSPALGLLQARFAAVAIIGALLGTPS
jgi:hypothetical protein